MSLLLHALLEMRPHLWGSVKFVPSSATECDKVPQRVLLHHNDDSRPCHLFSDIMERIDVEAQIKLKDLHQKAREHFDEVVKALPSTGKDKKNR